MNDTQSRTRLESMILFFASICGEQQRFGKTKLNKLLYYAEASARGMLGRPISDCTFVKKPYGPVPLGIEEILEEMEASGKIRVQHRPLVDGDFRETTLAPLVRPPDGVLTSAQSDLLRLVADRYWSHSGREISLESHDDIPGWDTLKPNGQVPVMLGFIVPESTDDPEGETETLLRYYTTKYHDALVALA